MLLKYYHIAKTLIENFECFKIYYIPRECDGSLLVGLLWRLDL